MRHRAVVHICIQREQCWLRDRKRFRSRKVWVYFKKVLFLGKAIKYVQKKILLLQVLKTEKLFQNIIEYTSRCYLYTFRNILVLGYFLDCLQNRSEYLGTYNIGGREGLFWTPGIQSESVGMIHTTGVYCACDNIKNMYVLIRYSFVTKLDKISYINIFIIILFPY